MLYFVLIYVLFTVIFVFETAQAILWVPEIRDDSPRRGMHDLFPEFKPIIFGQRTSEAKSWGLMQPDIIGKKRVTLIFFIRLLVFVK